MRAPFVLQSTRLSPIDVAANVRHPLMQHFGGWEVQTQHPDLRSADRDADGLRHPTTRCTAFFYVLPDGADRALVELTMISLRPRDREFHDDRSDGTSSGSVPVTSSSSAPNTGRSRWTIAVRTQRWGRPRLEPRHGRRDDEADQRLHVPADPRAGASPDRPVGGGHQPDTAPAVSGAVSIRRSHAAEHSASSPRTRPDRSSSGCSARQRSTTCSPSSTRTAGRSTMSGWWPSCRGRRFSERVRRSSGPTCWLQSRVGDDGDHARVCARGTGSDLAAGFQTRLCGDRTRHGRCCSRPTARHGVGDGRRVGDRVPRNPARCRRPPRRSGPGIPSVVRVGGTGICGRTPRRTAAFPSGLRRRDARVWIGLARRTGGRTARISR